MPLSSAALIKGLESAPPPPKKISTYATSPNLFEQEIEIEIDSFHIFPL